MTVRPVFLFAPRDVDALAKAVVRLMENEGMRRKFGENGMRKVNVECAPEVVGTSDASSIPSSSERLISHQRASNRKATEFANRVAKGLCSDSRRTSGLRRAENKGLSI